MITFEDKGGIPRRGRKMESFEVDQPTGWDWDPSQSKPKKAFDFTKSKKTWVFFSIYLTIILVLICGLLSSLFSDTTDKLSLTSIFKSLSTIMNEIPIKEVFPTELDCLEGQELNTLGYWPGTVRGCYYPSLKKLGVGECDSSRKSGELVEALDSF